MIRGAARARIGACTDEPGRECRAARCSDPCVDCLLLVCQEVAGGGGHRWELDAQLACPCGDAPPMCIDPETCDPIDGCPY